MSTPASHRSAFNLSNAGRRARPIRIASLTMLTFAWCGQAVFGLDTDAGGEGPADLVIRNGVVWTGVKSSENPSGPTESITSVAIKGDTIIAVGTAETITPLIDARTRILDVHERRIIPGITDSHTHIISGGFQLDRLSLRDAPNRARFVRAVGEAVKSGGDSGWILGGRWSVESWTDPSAVGGPTKAWIDEATGDVPVFLSRMDGHQALVNSAALRIAGISANGPPDPVGGEIVRDPATGEPTGILKDAAMGLVRSHVPQPSATQMDEALRRAMNHANSLGVTSVHDMSGLNDLEAFRRAHEAGDMTVRITVYLSVSDWPGHIPTAKRFGIHDAKTKENWLRVAGFKGYMDGSLGSRNAFMREPYSDAPPSSPYPRGQLTAEAADDERLRRRVATVDSAGLQIATHAIGDEANHLILNAYEASRKQRPSRTTPHRIEHAQHLIPSDISRFSSIGVVASMQPFHKADDGRYAEQRLGAGRLAGSYAFRQLLDADALLIFGSDWPVVTLNPFAGIDAAVNARTLDGKVWLPKHSITLPEALRAYTASPPQAIGQGARVGTIEVGKLADLVVLQQDPFAIPANQLGDVNVQFTIVGGKLVYVAKRQ